MSGWVGVPHVWLGCWTFPKDTIYPLYFNHLFEAPQDKKSFKTAICYWALRFWSPAK